MPKKVIGEDANQVKDSLEKNTSDSLRKKYIQISQDEINNQIEKIYYEEDKMCQNAKENNEFVDLYIYRKKVRNVIDRLTAEIKETFILEDFRQKAKFLINLINNYEEHYNDCITFKEDIKELGNYKNTPEYKILLALDIENATDLLSVFYNLEKNEGMDSKEIISVILHFLRKYHTQFEEYNDEEYEEIDFYKNRDYIDYYGSFGVRVLDFLTILERYNMKNTTYYQMVKIRRNEIMDEYRIGVEMEIGYSDIDSYSKYEKGKEGELQEEDIELQNSILQNDDESESYLMLLCEYIIYILNIKYGWNDVDDKKVRKQVFDTIIPRINKIIENNRVITANIIDEITGLVSVDYDGIYQDYFYDLLFNKRKLIISSTDIEIINSYFNFYLDILYRQLDDMKLEKENKYDERYDTIFESLKNKYYEFNEENTENKFITSKGKIYIIDAILSRKKLFNFPEIITEIMNRITDELGINSEAYFEVLLLYVLVVVNEYKKGEVNANNLEYILKTISNYINNLVKNYDTYKEIPYYFKQRMSLECNYIVDAFLRDAYENNLTKGKIQDIVKIINSLYNKNFSERRYLNDAPMREILIQAITEDKQFYNFELEKSARRYYNKLCGTWFYVLLKFFNKIRSEIADENIDKEIKKYKILINNNSSDIKQINVYHSNKEKPLANIPNKFKEIIENQEKIYKLTEEKYGKENKATLIEKIWLAILKVYVDETGAKEIYDNIYESKNKIVESELFAILEYIYDEVHEEKEEYVEDIYEAFYNLEDVYEDIFGKSDDTKEDCSF